MKKLLIGITVTAILALNIAALDDITTGSEPNYTGEWAIVIGSMVLLAALIVRKVWKHKIATPV